MLQCLTSAGPALRRLRRFPAQLAHRWLGKRNSFKYRQIAFGFSLQHSLLHRDPAQVLRLLGACASKHSKTKADYSKRIQIRHYADSVSAEFSAAAWVLIKAIGNDHLGLRQSL